MSAVAAPHRGRSAGQRGITLVEALVALAVLGFGLLAYVGVQSTLRINGDLARQRAEAVRIAQDTVESWRAFSVLRADPAQPDLRAFDDILASALLPPVTVVGTNATYTVTRSVDADAALGLKTVVVDVDWRDRADALQSLRLATAIAEVAPELAGTLAVPGDGVPGRRLAGRHPAIPLDAMPVDGGRSRLPIAQPDGSVVTLEFDDLSGLITSLCMQPGRCDPVNARLLSGHVRYATLPTAPTPTDAERPPSAAQPPAGVELRRTAPVADTLTCLTQRRSHDIRYFCAVPISLPPAGVAPGWTQDRWSGRTVLTGLPLANSLNDASADHFRVCRYTPHRDHRAVGTGSPPMRNADHPLDYLDVSTALTNQNFLVIRAGDGTAAFDCPDDDPATEFVNGRTWHHQPAQ